MIFLFFVSFLFRFSVSNDLKYDAERDLKDIDAPNIPVHALNKVIVLRLPVTIVQRRKPVLVVLTSSVCVSC